MSEREHEQGIKKDIDKRCSNKGSQNYALSKEVKRQYWDRQLKAWESGNQP